MSSESPFPEGWRLTPNPGLERRSNGQILLGGYPLRLLRLTEAGSTQVSKWFRGAPIPTSPTTTKLARKLIAAGMAHAVPSNSENGSVDEKLTIVIPVKDDHTGLAATLSSIQGSNHRQLKLIIVDDGSAEPVSRPGLNISEPTQIIRNEQQTGPGSARNRGLVDVTTDLVAFIDAGVVLGGDDLERLARHLQDPEVLAVAPRVQSAPLHTFISGPPDAIDSPTPRSARLARYERYNSPLDLGQHRASVGPGHAVAYVPSACLLVRSGPLRSMSEHSFVFDPELRYGEDVDLEWRLVSQGTILYDPSIVVSHSPRADIKSFVQQRIGYGSAAAPLAKRHGRVVAPFRSSPWSVAISILTLTGHPVLAALLIARSANRISKKLQGRVPDHQIEAARLTSIGQANACVSLGHVAIREWWPAALLALAAPPLRMPVAKLIGWGLASKVWRHRQADPIEMTTQAMIGILDDLSYGYGVWRGAWTERSIQSLLPDFRSVSVD